MMSEVQIDYDKKSDVLYISFGLPRKAIGIELSEGYILRIDPYTDTPVGITIIDFKYKQQKGLVNP